MQQSFAVSLVAQAISFGTAPPSGALVGDAAYVVSATASSGLAVAFTVDAASAGVCTVSGATVSLVGAGTCIVDAGQPGNGSYQPAPQVQQSFAVATPSLSVQSVNFTSTPPAGAVVGGATYSLAAGASSGLPVSFTVAPASAGVCSLAGLSVSFAAAGTCTILAEPGGQRQLPAGAAGPAVVRRLPRAADDQLRLRATRRRRGRRHDVHRCGERELRARRHVRRRAGQRRRLLGERRDRVVQRDRDVHRRREPAGRGGLSGRGAGSAVVHGLDALGQLADDQLHVEPAGRGGGGCDLQRQRDGKLGSRGDLQRGVGERRRLHRVGIDGLVRRRRDLHGHRRPGGRRELPGRCAGAAILRGRPAGTDDQLRLPPPVGAISGDPDYTVSATATSGLPVTFTAGPGSAGICTVSGSSVSLIGTGTCVVTASQAGDAGHQAAPQAQQSFSIGGAPAASVQAITFTSSAPAGAVVGGASYTVAATASSGLTVVFGADPASAGVCTVTGSTVSMIGAGTCTVDASQPGNASYLAAPQVQQSFVVGLVAQTISFTSSPPGGATVGGASYALSATAGSGLPVTFTIAAGSAGVCTLSGSTVSFAGAGTCTIRADQSGNATYAAAPQVQQSFTVTSPPPPSSPQSITFTSGAPAATVGGAGYTVSASASSGLAVTFSLAASSAGVCTLSGSLVSFVGTGTCTIDANQGGNGSYQAAPQAQQSFAVGLASQTISFTSSPPGGATVGGATYTVTATASSGLTVSLTVAPASAGVCSLSGSVVSFGGAGTCTIRANQAGNGSYQAAAQAQQSFTVTSPASKSVQTIQFSSTPPAGAVIGGPAYTVAATASSGLAVGFTLAGSSAGVCTLAGSTVSLVGAGTCTINANQAGNASYQAAPQVQQSFTVGLRSQTIGFTSNPPGSALVGGTYYGRRNRHLGAPRDVRCRRGQRGGVLDLGCNRLADRRRYVRDPGEPGRQRNLPGGSAGAAVVHCRPGLADDHVHVDTAECRQARPALHGHRNLELRARGRLHDRSVERGHLLGLRLDGVVQRPRNLHRLRKPARRRKLASGAAGSAGLPGQEPHARFDGVPRTGEARETGTADAT